MPSAPAATRSRTALESSALVLALVVATAAVVIALGVGTMVVHVRRASDRLLRRGLHEMHERMDLLARELRETVERVHEDAARARIIESLGQALDLDEVLARCAEAAVSLPGVAGALVGIEVDASHHGASAGLGSGADGAVSGPPDGSQVRAVGISYHYAEGESAFQLRSAIAVPIEYDARQLGFLTVFGRGDEAPVTNAEFETLETIARHTGPAIEKARRRVAGPHRLDTDRLTGFGNRHLFHETLALEVARAHRHGRMLAVCVLDIDDFRLANGRFGQFAGDALLVEVAKHLRDSIGPADIACRTGGDEFAVILPASSRIDAEVLFARFQEALSRPPVVPCPSVSLSAGIAELAAGDDGVSLYERAGQALRRAKVAGKGTAA